MKRVLFLLLVVSGAAGAWLWWQRRLDAQQQDVWTQVMTPEPQPEPPAPVKKAPAKKSTAAKKVAKKSSTAKARPAAS